MLQRTHTSPLHQECGQKRRKPGNGWPGLACQLFAELATKAWPGKVCQAWSRLGFCSDPGHQSMVFLAKQQTMPGFLVLPARVKKCTNSWQYFRITADKAWEL